LRHTLVTWEDGGHEVMTRLLRPSPLYDIGRDDCMNALDKALLRTVPGAQHGSSNGRTNAADGGATALCL
jgi:hypothetical protein